MGWVITMAMVDVDCSCQFSADSQPKLTGLIWGLAATWCPGYIHQMNRANSSNDVGHDDNNNNNTRLTALCQGLPGWAGTRNVKPVWILLKQETVSGSGISWAICKSAPCSRQTTTPAPHHSVFLQAGCPSCRPTNSVKSLKANIGHNDSTINTVVVSISSNVSEKPKQDQLSLFAFMP